MSYQVQLNRKLPEQGVYDQLLGGHIVNRKNVKLYPKSGGGPFGPSGQNTISFRLPSHGYLDCLRSYISYDLVIQNTKGSTFVDNNIWMLGGSNGSSASPFRTFRILYDGEPIEYIENYHGLVAMMSQNIPDSYRKNAMGSLQCFTSYDLDEACYDMASRFGCTQHQNGHIGERGRPAANGAVTEAGLIHMPASGILGNSKLLPVKFLGNVDVEFMLGSTQEVLQIIGHGPYSRKSTTVTGSTTASDNVNMAGMLRNPQLSTATVPVANLAYLLGGGGQYHYNDTQKNVAIGNEFTELIQSSHYTYQILNPVYHLEIVYMTEAYDAAFAEALTRGVTYSFETFTNTVAPMTGASGIVNIPVSKTSIQSIYQGFVIDFMQNRITTNHWHFMCPDMLQWQLKFGAKLVPAEPVDLATDGGLQHLMLYLKTTNQHYNPLAGFAQHIAYTNDEYIPWDESYVNDTYNYYNENFNTFGDNNQYNRIIGPNKTYPYQDAAGVPRGLPWLTKAGVAAAGSETSGTTTDNPASGTGAVVATAAAFTTDVQILSAIETATFVGEACTNVKAAVKRLVMNTSIKNGCSATTNIWGGGSRMMLRHAGSNGTASLVGQQIDVTDDTFLFAERKFDDSTTSGSTFDPKTVRIPASSIDPKQLSIPSMGSLCGTWIKKRPLASGERAYQQYRQLDVYSRYLGYWALAVDIEAEENALSGINTAGSTAMLQFHYVRDSDCTAPILVYSWVMHDKAIRLEPFGRMTVIVD